MPRVLLAHPADLDGFRLALRALVAAGTPPESVDWQTGGTAGAPAVGPDAPPLSVPRRFADLAGQVVCHAAPDRFILLHRVALALRHDRAFLDCRTDPLVARLEAMAEDVARDIRQLQEGLSFHETCDDEGPLLVAWAQPTHHVLRASIGVFIRRLAAARWRIMTPEESAYWDGTVLSFLPGRATPGAAPTCPADPLEPLRRAARACTLCPLHGPATQTVFGEGPADARLMLVGEQPGDQEDREGRPFVGPAGRLLDRCLAEAGIDRSTIYITNAVKHFKFTPTARRRLHQSPDAAEIEACRWWLDQERALIRPALVLMLGASAARALLRRPVTVGRERGRPLLLPDGATAFLTVHPSYLLRIDHPAAADAERARFVDDLRAARALAG